MTKTMTEMEIEEVIEQCDQAIAELDRLRAELGHVEPAEEPDVMTEVRADGHRCECCCATMPAGTPVAVFMEDDAGEPEAIMSVDLYKLEATARAATPGDRHLEQDRNDQWNVYAGEEWLALVPHQCVLSIEEQRAKDAEFFAVTSPEVILELIARVRGAERIVDAAVKWYASVRAKAQHARMEQKELDLWKAARDYAELPRKKP